MTLSFKLCVVLVVFGVIHSSQGQYWKNEKRDKHSSVADSKSSSSSVAGSSSSVVQEPAAAKSGPYEYGHASEYKDDYAHVPAYEHVPASVYEHHPASYAHEYKPPSYHAPAYQAPAYHAPSYSAPVYSVHEYKAPTYETHESHEHIAAHGQGYHHSSSYESSHEYPAPAPAYPSSHESYPSPSYQPSYSQASNPLPSVLPYGAYPIQQPTITNTGETIIENLVGGIPFDCHGKSTGHHRDYKYCDIFHACVYGMQRKTYACPYVGERTYFDEVTKRCEFVYKNPSGCGHNTYYH